MGGRDRPSHDGYLRGKDGGSFQAISTAGRATKKAAGAEAGGLISV
jgi:hypothetical protein